MVHGAAAQNAKAREQLPIYPTLPFSSGGSTTSSSSSKQQQAATTSFKQQQQHAALAAAASLAAAAPPHTTAAMARRSCVALMSVLAAVVDGSDESVHGVNLGKCNRDLAHDPNWPSTGYMRGDYCTATSSDAGSHYLCVDLPDATTSSGSHYSPFWVETGQSPSGEEAAELPLAGPWCICMWAFRSMYAQHNEFAGMIDCTASNSWVVENYVSSAA